MHRANRRSRFAMMVALGLVAAGNVHPQERKSLTDRAEALLTRVYREHDSETRFALADQALALCQEAQKSQPKDPLPRLLGAEALSVTDLQHPEACRVGACERAIAMLKEARALGERGEYANKIASELGLVLSRSGKFGEALAEYDHALGLIDSERRTAQIDELSRANLYGNSAETLMALGRLSEAIARYRQAEAAAQLSGHDLARNLALWGLGVALDRDEQMEASRATIERVLQKEPTMASLSDDEVFFEPPGDKSYYVALGHEIAGDVPQAIAAFSAFVTEAPKSRWIARANAHLDALAKLPRAKAEAGQLLIGGPLIEHPDRPRRPIARLREVLRSYQPDLQLCLERAIRSDAALARRSGLLLLRLEIQPEGFLHAEILQSTLESTPLEECIERAAQSWRFPPIDGNERELVTIPLELGASASRGRR